MQQELTPLSLILLRQKQYEINAQEKQNKESLSQSQEGQKEKSKKSKNKKNKQDNDKQNLPNQLNENIVKTQDTFIALEIDSQIYQQFKDVAECIKVVKANYNFENINIQVSDVSLKSKGGFEDKLFGLHSNVFNNIRRGVGIASYENNHNFIKKGLKKFFDFDYDWLKLCKANDDLQNQIHKYEQEIKGYEKGIFGYSFKNVLATCLNQKETLIYQMEKANGENAQISYLTKFDKWVIGSKNVTILVGSEEELQQKNEEREVFAKLIGQTWFQMLKQIDVDKAKQLLDNHTFVAEYVGNPNYQHLVTYQKTQLKFYAITNHSSQQTCIHPKNAFEIFQTLKLPTVKFLQFQATNLQQLYDVVQTIYVDVSSSPLEDAGEGAVVYFVTESDISLAKIKNLEYRFFRKIREKMKHVLNDEAKEKLIKSLLQKFSNESKELSKDFKANRPLSFYYLVCYLVLKFMFNNREWASKNIDRIINKYCNFLNVFLKNYKDVLISFSQKHGEEMEGTDELEIENKISIEEIEQQLN